MSTPLNTTIASPNSSIEEKQLNLIQKYLNDLEDLAKKLAEQQAANPDEVFSDDCTDLQKFCSKLEFLIQFKIKEKKSIFDSTLSISSAAVDGASNLITTYSSRDYWSFFVEVFKSSRGFQDAIKYVKSLNELKTNIGRGRAFIRFCLQYHRLADAIQQLMMEKKIVNNWYKEKAVWHDDEQKSRIFQILYDLNDVSFELLSKSNFELDTTWPTIQVNNPRIQITRHRTNSLTSYTSYYQEREQGENLLSSTPLEMDNEFLISKMNRSANQDDTKSIDIHSTYQLEMEQQETKITELTNKLAQKDDQLDTILNEMKKKSFEASFQNGSEISSSTENDSTMFLEKMASQISLLNQQLTAKVHQNNDLNDSLVKQTSMCERVSALLKNTQEKCDAVNSERKTHLEMIEKLQNDFLLLNKDYNDLKLQYDGKISDELTYELTINQLKTELTEAKEEKARVTKEISQKIKQNSSEMQLKEEKIYMLNVQVEKLSKTLEKEVQKVTILERDMSVLKEQYGKLNDKNQKHIEQLEDDNIEIKKRLVKLIKEKADLWQKADNLEYEKLCRVNATWIDDDHVTNCLTCNSTFNILLRKHHCRICLKIFCYYCCNNWIDYNNSKLRCCQRCFETRSTQAQFNENIPKISTREDLISQTSMPITDDLKNLGIDSMTSSNVTAAINDADEESDPDINFEVRSEKLHLSNEKVDVAVYNSASHSSVDEIGHSIYLTTKPVKEKVKPGNPSESKPGNPFGSEHGNPFEEDETHEAKIKEALNSIDRLQFANELTSIYPDETSDLIICKKKVQKRKKKPCEPLKCNKSIEDLISNDNIVTKSATKTSNDDSFTILSQDEIDRAK